MEKGLKCIRGSGFRAIVNGVRIYEICRYAASLMFDRILICSTSEEVNLCKLDTKISLLYTTFLQLDNLFIIPYILSFYKVSKKYFLEIRLHFCCIIYFKDLLTILYTYCISFFSKLHEMI